MNNRGQVSDPMLAYLAVIMWVAIGLYLLASIAVPSLRFERDLYLIYWGIFLFPLVLAALGHIFGSEHEDPQTRLDDWHD